MTTDVLTPTPLPRSRSGSRTFQRVWLRRVRARIANPADAIQVTLGLLWLLDGLLQLQPAMFTHRFAREVILPPATGQPGFIAWPIHQAVHVILWAPGPINAVAALLQIGIGVGLMFRASVRPAIVVSILWSLNVWIVGEGIGGLASGAGMLLTGAPGAVLLYAVLAAAVWPGRDRPARWLVQAWVSLWVGAAILQLLPQQASNRAIRASISANADQAPGWLRSLDHLFLSALPKGGQSIAIALVALELVIGLSVLAARPYRTWGIALGILFALIAWIVGQSLGTYWTGLATDPNSGPLIVLMGLGVAATTSRTARRRSPVVAESHAARTRRIEPARET